MTTPMFHCEECGCPVDEDNLGCLENNTCEVCNDKWHAEQYAYWKPLYDGEKAAGLLGYDEARKR